MIHEHILFVIKIYLYLINQQNLIKQMKFGGVIAN